jgi:hypothetical protein
MPPLVLEVAASVTSCRHSTGPTVLNEHRQGCTRGSATVLGGDVVGTYEIAVALELAVRTEESAAFGFGDALSTGGTGGTGAALVHQPHDDAGSFGLIPQGLHKVGASPLSSAEILQLARTLAGDALGVANQQGADLMLDSKGDCLLGGFMLSLADATAMTGLRTPQANPVMAPPSRPAVARPGSSPRHPCVAGLLVV